MSSPSHHSWYVDTQYMFAITSKQSSGLSSNMSFFSREPFLIFPPRLGSVFYTPIELYAFPLEVLLLFELYICVVL